MAEGLEGGSAWKVGDEEEVMPWKRMRCEVAGVEVRGNAMRLERGDAMDDGSEFGLPLEEGGMMAGREVERREEGSYRSFCRHRVASRKKGCKES